MSSHGGGGGDVDPSRSERKDRPPLKSQLRHTHNIFLLFFPNAEAVAEIIEAPELHINEGSTMRLECKLKRATESPLYVFWYVFSTAALARYVAKTKRTHLVFLLLLLLIRYHDARMVNYDSDDGVSVTANRHKSSILTVQNATIRHGGNYTCAPANAKPTSISVHVLKGKHSGSLLPLLCR